MIPKDRTSIGWMHFIGCSGDPCICDLPFDQWPEDAKAINNVAKTWQPSAEILKLAAKALENMEARKDEDIDAWAEALAEDLSKFTD